MRDVGGMLLRRWLAARDAQGKLRIGRGRFRIVLIRSVVRIALMLGHSE
jgi:hypothetical protein